MAVFLKDPGARIDYAIDWSRDYLGGATISGSAWRVEPDGAGAGGVVVAASAVPVPVPVQATGAAAARTAVTLAGGVAGTVYRVINSIDLSDGRRDERMLVVRVEER